MSIKNIFSAALCLLIVSGGIFTASAQETARLERATPEEVGMDSAHLAFADAAIERAISAGDIPGAVLAVVRNGKMAYIKAFGNRRVVPETELMTENTIFDMASCTKPVAVATSAMILVERGCLRLLDPVSDFIPSFKNWRGADGKRRTIRIIDLMTHTSGLPSYITVQRLERDYGSATGETLLNYICTCRREFEPQSDFLYSCLNYIALQYIVESVSGMSLRDFARENIFAPLGMAHTDFIPCTETSGTWTAASTPCWAVDGEDWTADIAPTERLKTGQILCGVVQDPLARIPHGGISGNAGLFSTADDLALFCAALLGGGAVNGTRILSPLAVDVMTRVPRAVSTLGRTPGWDIFTPYSSVNGDLFSPDTYGHTGHTGTSIVIDPDNDTAVILLANSVHPDEGHSMVRLRSLVANAVAASLRCPAE